jgi:hypothetical protein
MRQVFVSFLANNQSRASVESPSVAADDSLAGVDGPVRYLAVSAGVVGQLLHALVGSQVLTNNSNSWNQKDCCGYCESQY